ncbi:hypothetical protein AB1Y20_011400 [Prymnesium parvum]|uniref:Ran-binding protein 10 n=1 Tax=Prymnesium parvum TaxID=97485 RepID=A0AB34IQH2_PRYPA
MASSAPPPLPALHAPSEPTARASSPSSRLPSFRRGMPPRQLPLDRAPCHAGEWAPPVESRAGASPPRAAREARRDAAEPLPSCMDITTRPRSLVVGKDKLSLRYVGKGNHSHDAGSMRANHPCPKRCSVYYFEATVLDAGARGCVSIGLADQFFLLNRRPGWEANTYAYLGEDGKRYNDCERGEPYGPTFGTGDVVGCGLLCDRREVFFTKNGKHLGVAFSDIACSLYPTVSLHSPNESVRVNLGGTPFTFDLDGLVRDARREKLAQVMLYKLPSGVMSKLIEAYLLHYTFDGTLAKLRESAGIADGGAATPNGKGKAERPTAAAVTAEGDVLMDDAGNEEGPRTLEDTMELRRELRARVLRGDIDGAFELCGERYEGLLARHDHAHFLLLCQGFIEVIRGRQPLKAIEYARERLMPFQSAPGMDEAKRALLRDVFALIAYDEPEGEESPVRYLMQPAHRHVVAEALNAAILDEHRLSPTTAIERLLRQLNAVQEAVLDANLGYGKAIEL